MTKTEKSEFRIIFKNIFFKVPIDDSNTLADWACYNHQTNHFILHIIVTHDGLALSSLYSNCDNQANIETIIKTDSSLFFVEFDKV